MDPYRGEPSISLPFKLKVMQQQLPWIWKTSQDTSRKQK
jgi:hypothetical protein